MTAIIGKWFEIFASKTGILGEIRQYQEFGIWLLLVVGGLGCFFGFKVYRAMFSVNLFLAIALAGSVVLGGRIDWGAVVTFFSVVGVALAVLGYGWYRLGGVAICALAGAMMAIICSGSLWPGLAVAIIFGILVLLFPVITICFTTSLWGSWLFFDALCLVTGMNSQFLWLFIAAAAAAGFLLQLYMSRKQKMFSRLCPDRMRYWMEKRRRLPA